MILVTGATGFVGSTLIARAVANGLAIRGTSRRAPSQPIAGVEYVSGHDLSGEPDWAELVRGVRIVVHTAARVHMMHETAADPLEAFRAVNVRATRDLAMHAAAAGARRFVYLSSIKVNGESGVFSEASVPNPLDPYGQSKHEAEIALATIARDTGMEVVIIRPPLVYGPGVKANFRALMRAIDRGIPLPLAGVDNRRSLVAVENLADFIITAAHHPGAANETFLISDGEDLSTPELVRRLARAMGRPARLFWVPPSLMRIGATVLGKGAAVNRLLGNLQIDSSKARRALGWTPPLSVDDALRRTVLG